MLLITLTIFKEDGHFSTQRPHADSWKEIKQIEKAGMAEDQKKAQERAVYLATQQIIEHLQKSLDKYGDNDYK